MIGRRLISAIAATTSCVNNFGTALTPMMAVGRSALIASTKWATGGRSNANGFWKSARSVRELTIRPLMSNSALRLLASAISMPSRVIAWLISSAIPVPAEPPPEQPLVGDLHPGDALRGEDAGERDRGGALDIVIEGADLVAVARQDRDRVVVGKVLPLDAAFRIERLHRIDELVDKLHVLGAAHPVLAQAQIERIFKQGGVVGADIEPHRQAVLRRN